MKNLLPKPAQSLGRLLVCFVMLQRGSGAGVVPQIPEEKQESHAERYADTDAYQIYAALLEADGHSQYVIQGELLLSPDLSDYRTETRILSIKSYASYFLESPFRRRNFFQSQINFSLSSVMRSICERVP